MVDRMYYLICVNSNWASDIAFAFSKKFTEKKNANRFKVTSAGSDQLKKLQ